MSSIGLHELIVLLIGTFGTLLKAAAFFLFGI